MKKSLGQIHVRVIARRELHDGTTGGLIEILVYEPTPDPADKQGDWACQVEIRRNSTDVVSLTGHGVDSLQALLTGLSGLRQALKNDAGRLTWFGKLGEIGLPLMIAEEDPDFIALLDHLIDAEYCRQTLSAKRYRVAPKPAPKRRLGK